MSRILPIRAPLPYPVKWVNCYYIDDSTPTLIDTGVNTDECLEIIQHAVEEAGGNIRSLKRIIATHAHVDHIGLAGRLAEISGAEVYVHPWEFVGLLARPGSDLDTMETWVADFMTRGGADEATTQEALGGIRPRFRAMLATLSSESPMEDGDLFDFDDFRLEVIHTPGHSPGSVCLFDREQGRLFSGDAVIEEVTCNPAARIGEAEEGRRLPILRNHLASLGKIRELPVKQILPGHGAPFSDHKGRIDRLVAFHARRREQIIDALTNHSAHPDHRTATPLDIARRLFPSMSGIEVFHRICGVRVHLEVLEEDGVVVSGTREGKLCYSLKQ